MGRSTPILCRYTLSWNRNWCSNNIKDYILCYFDLYDNWSKLNWWPCWEKHSNWKIATLLDPLHTYILSSFSELWPVPAKLPKVASRFCRGISVFSLVSSAAKSFSINNEHCSIHCQWHKVKSIFVIAWSALPQQINIHNFLFCSFFFFLSCCFFQLCDKPVSWHDWWNCVWYLTSPTATIDQKIVSTDI